MMKYKLVKQIIIGILIIFIITGIKTSKVIAEDLNQLPTVSIPTVTSTLIGAMITVRLDQDQINVRAGPGTNYEKVGVLLPGQQAPAKGKSAGGDWIMIEYLGIPGGVAWVFSSLVSVTPGALPIIEPPPTPTPLYTLTIDPTLAAQFIVTPIPTRMPTFTAPPPLVIPTFQDATQIQLPGGIPMGLVIIGLGAIGVFIGLFTLAQGR